MQSVLGAGDQYATVDLNVKMLRPARVGHELIVEGKLLHIARNVGFAEGRIVDAEETVYAQATATLMIRRAEPGTGEGFRI